MSLSTPNSTCIRTKTHTQDRQLHVDPETGKEIEGHAMSSISKAHRSEEIFNKGTSKRIWGELYKVVDAADVICFVLDARDPMGTRRLGNLASCAA